MDRFQPHRSNACPLAVIASGMQIKQNHLNFCHPLQFTCTLQPITIYNATEVSFQEYDEYKFQSSILKHKVSLTMS